MSKKTAWQCLSVDEFISKCNWENISLTRSANTGSQSQNLTAWQCLTAQEFFCQNNWSGQVILVDPAEDRDPRMATTVFDLTLATEQFWQCFNWSGQQNLPAVEIGDRAIAEAEKLINTAEEFTLNDLSQLF